MYFLADLEHQHAFLRALGHVVHQRRAARCSRRQGCTGHGAFQARNNVVGLWTKVGGPVEIIFQRRLDEQQRGRHFESLRFACGHLGFAYMCSNGTHDLHDVGKILVWLLLRRRVKRFTLGHK